MVHRPGVDAWEGDFEEHAETLYRRLPPLVLGGVSDPCSSRIGLDNIKTISTAHICLGNRCRS